jgi:iduronate 2-sulfatase
MRRTIYPDHQICDKTLADLRRLAKQDKPFFLACGFYRPHLPFVVPQKYWDLYPTDQVTLPDNMFFPHDLPAAFNYTWGEMRSYHGIPKQGPGLGRHRSATDPRLLRLRQLHRRPDRQTAGRARNELGVADNTIIVLWGDHGWQLGEHGFWCKHTNFEVAARTAADRGPKGSEKGGSVFSRRLVEFIDIFPDPLRSGRPAPTGTPAGKSMKPVAADADAEHKEAVFTRHGGGDAVRTDRYRYKEMRSQGGRGELLGVGLFDLEKDPQENRNVAEVPAYAETRQADAPSDARFQFATFAAQVQNS